MSKRGVTIGKNDIKRDKYIFTVDTSWNNHIRLYETVLVSTEIGSMVESYDIKTFETYEDKRDAETGHKWYCNFVLNHSVSEILEAAETSDEMEFDKLSELYLPVS